MRKIVCMMLVCIGMCVCAMAQNDKVFLHNGTTMEVSVKGISNGVITYSYPGESMTQEVSEKQVEKIVFASGREQQVSEKVIVRDKSDWEKVIITNIESDVAGLVQKGEVKGSKTGSSLSNTAKIQEKAEREMKEEAAKMGAHVIFIKNYQVRDGGGMNAVTGFGHNAKASVSGTAYGYE